MRIPASLLWLAVQLAALWPQLLWTARRLRDGSDDPLGMVALAALILWMLRLAPQLRATPDLRWLGCAALLTVGTAIGGWFLPPLLTALFGTLALSASIFAWLPARAARLPVVGFAVLSLPLLSSLQFYVGYPLRIVTAQLSTWLLQAGGIEAARSGASMVVNGRLVIVDAPCSGVQMAWLAYFSALAVAALVGVGDAVLLRRLPWVGALVLAGNTLRNAVLVTLEARPQAPGALVHEVVGLVMLALVCGLVVQVMRRGAAHVAVA